jgi:hypothetical protein
MQNFKSLSRLLPTLILTGVFCAHHLDAAPQRDDSRDTEKLDNTFKVRTDSDFHLRLEVDAGEVRVSRGQSEEQLTVHLIYTKTQFRHAFRFNEQDNRLEIRFDKDGWFDRDAGHITAELEIELPRDATIHADCRIKAGEVKMQLGGLRVADFAMSVTAGEVNVDFDQPNRVEMQSLKLNTRIGESNFRRLGNARFRDADINGGIGEMTIDFSGAMLPAAMAEVDLDIGETVIVLPQDAGAKLSISKFLFLSQIAMPFDFRKDGRYYYTDNYGKAGQDFELRISSGIGEVRIERP